MATIYEEICEACKTTAKDGETQAEFAKRATDKINGLSEDKWGELSNKLQVWSNATLKALEEETDLPDIKGFPEPEEASGDVEDGGEDEGDDGGDDAVGGEGEDAPAEDAPGEDAPAEDAPAEDEGVDGGEETRQEEPSARRRVAASSKKKDKAVAKGKQKDKPATKEKDVTTTKRRQPTAGTPRVSDNARIKVLTKKNPHREGTKLHTFFSKYKDGMTVAEAKKAKIPPKNIAYLQGLGHIKLTKAA